MGNSHNSTIHTLRNSRLTGSGSQPPHFESTIHGHTSSRRCKVFRLYTDQGDTARIRRLLFFLALVLLSGISGFLPWSCGSGWLDNRAVYGLCCIGTRKKERIGCPLDTRQVIQLYGVVFPKDRGRRWTGVLKAFRLHWGLSSGWTRNDRILTIRTRERHGWTTG